MEWRGTTEISGIQVWVGLIYKGGVSSMPIAIGFFVGHAYAILFAWVLVEQLGLPVPSIPLLLAAGQAELAQRLTAEHGQLRELRTQLCDPDSVILRAFGELLAAHVRFEEREMFIALEALLEN